MSGWNDRREGVSNEMAESIRCPRCDGMGIVGWGRHEAWCPYCHGVGVVVKLQKDEQPSGAVALSEK